MGFDVNTVVVSGNLTRDPEIRYLQNGDAVSSFGVAWNQSVKQQDGSYSDRPHFFNVTMFGNVGKAIAEEVAQGDKVVFHGRLEYRTWQDKNTGQNRSAVEIRAYDAVTGRRKGEGRSGGQGGGDFGGGGGGWSGGGGGWSGQHGGAPQGGGQQGGWGGGSPAAPQGQPPQHAAGAQPPPAQHSRPPATPAEDDLHPVRFSGRAQLA